MQDLKEITDIIFNAIDDKKGEDIKVIDIQEISTLADYFIIATGDNINHVHSIADNVEEQLSKIKMNPKQIEGYQNANWVLMDYGNVVIHIFDRESRAFYNLDNIWKDGKILA